MKLATFIYKLKNAEVSIDEIKNIETRLKLIRIADNARSLNVERVRRLTGSFAFQFDTMLSDHPYSCAIEPYGGVIFNLTNKNSRINIFYCGGLMMNVLVEFPVIVADFFETIEDINEYIASAGLEHSCWISSIKFRNDWNIVSDFGFQLTATQVSARRYTKVPVRFIEFYEENEARMI